MITFHISLKEMQRVYREFILAKHPYWLQHNTLDDLDAEILWNYNSAYAIIIYETGDVCANLNNCHDRKIQGFTELQTLIDAITHETFHDIFQHEQLEDYPFIHSQWDNLDFSSGLKKKYFGVIL